MALLHSGGICEIRRGFGDRKVIDEMFDSHVNEYLMQSVKNQYSIGLHMFIFYENGDEFDLTRCLIDSIDNDHLHNYAILLFC